MFHEDRLHALLAWRWNPRHVAIDRKANRLTVKAGETMVLTTPPLAIRDVEIHAPRYLKLLDVFRIDLEVHYPDKTCTVAFQGNAATIKETAAAIEQWVVDGFAPTVTRLSDFVEQFQQAIDKELPGDRYARGSRYQRFLETQKIAREKLQADIDILSTHPYAHLVAERANLLKKIASVDEIIDVGDSHRKQHNKRVIKDLATKHEEYFAKVESSRLSDEQIRASLTFDDANLTVAAAGSGKSSVIVSKVGFALKTNLFSEKEILVLAFNTAAAKEIRDRLRKCISEDVKVTASTFHAVGFRLWRQKNRVEKGSARPLVVDFSKASKTGKGRGRALLVETIQNMTEQNNRFADGLLEWAALHRYESPEATLGIGIGADDADTLEKRYEDLCKQISRAKDGKRRKWSEAAIPTLDPTKFVRSFEEARIFNWLYLRGVMFGYEQHAPKFVKDNINTGLPVAQQVRTYLPDFTYPHPFDEGRSYFHEHFGISSKGTAPDFIGGQRYVDRANHKRRVMRQCFQAEDRRNKAARFFETTSGDFANGSIFDKLAKELSLRDIYVGSIDKDRRKKALAALCSSAPLIDDLILPFIALYRDSGLTFKDLFGRASTLRDPQRAIKFLQLMEAVDHALRERMEKGSSSGRQIIDYSAMISEATRFLSSGGDPVVPVKFVLVDEFQDIARSRAQFVQALLDQHPEESMLYCVGDDWQAINRFAGSDLAIFRDLYDAGNVIPRSPSADSPLRRRSTDLTELGTTYRCDQGIADVAKTFVMKGGHGLHINKSVTAISNTGGAVIHIVGHDDDGSSRIQALYAELGRIAQLPMIMDDGKERAAKVFVLTRNRNSLPEGLTIQTLKGLESRYFKHGLVVEWHTLHTSKGLGADYVVIVGMDAGYHGFPRDYPNEPLIEMLKPRMADPWDEERRLFYVGLTRAKREVNLLCVATSPSIFIHELLEGPHQDRISRHQIDDVIRHLCPACRQSWVKRVDNKYGDKSSYVHCMRHPYCGYRDKVERYPDLSAPAPSAEMTK